MVEVSLESRLEIFLSCALFFFFRLDVSSFRVFTLRSVAATLSLSLSPIFFSSRYARNIVTRGRSVIAPLHPSRFIHEFHEFPCDRLSFHSFYSVTIRITAVTDSERGG